MKRLIIFSDSHGDLSGIFRVLNKEKDFDGVFHLGDIQWDGEELESRLYSLRPLSSLLIVKGNCDICSELPSERIVEYYGVKILICHGHTYQVNYSKEHLSLYAGKCGCSIAMFGHTHKPEINELHGVTLFNPGSISFPRQEGKKPSYGILEINEDGSFSLSHGFI